MTVQRCPIILYGANLWLKPILASGARTIMCQFGVLLVQFELYQYRCDQITMIGLKFPKLSLNLTHCSPNRRYCYLQK